MVQCPKTFYWLESTFQPNIDFGYYYVNASAFLKIVFVALMNLFSLPFSLLKNFASNKFQLNFDFRSLNSPCTPIGCPFICCSSPVAMVNVYFLFQNLFSQIKTNSPADTPIVFIGNNQWYFLDFARISLDFS